MATKRLKLADLKATLVRDMKTLEGRTISATHKAADFGRLVAYSKAPVAFAELRDGIVDERLPRGARVVSTAPHSGAVEHGSRPHWPPMAPLIAWVKLRGTQGVDVGAGAIGHPGRVAAQIRSFGTATSTKANAPEKVAWLIAKAIAKRGTKPTFFMQRSVPEVVDLLDGFVKTLYREDL